MAGRGTDIKLGGNKDFLFDGKKENENDIKENEKKVKNLGRFIYYWYRET